VSSRYFGGVQLTARHATRCSTAVTLALAAMVVSGCAATDGLMSSVALPNDRTSTTPARAGDKGVSPVPAPPGSAGTASSKLAVTGQQRAYLNALVAAGVHPSSDLMALSIGSYVCQARAAGQSPEDVWDFVHPLVSSDVQNSHGSSGAVDAATKSYIRIATQRLC